MLAGLERALHDRAREGRAADQLDDDAGLHIIQRLGEILAEDGGIGPGLAGLGEIHIHHVAQQRPHARAAGQKFVVAHQQPHDGAAHRAAADQGDADCLLLAHMLS